MCFKLSFNVIQRVLFLMALMLFVHSFSKSHQVSATHAAGSDLTYRNLSGNQYEIEVSFYRDCAGIDEPPVITVYYRSISCGYNLNVTAVVVPGSGNEISVPCSSSVSTCNNGITTGIKKFTYIAIVNLPSLCADWVFSYSICCRNCSITTVDNPCSSGSNLYVEAKLNNLLAPQNNSHSFSNNPIAFVCVGQNFNFNQGVFDPDGDSLAYSLIAPKTSATTEVLFLPPATTLNPLASSSPFILDPITGDLNFTPSQIQIGILAVLVKEFRNGQLIGSVIRDIQIYSTACFNNLPTVTGINGTNNYSLTVCPGQTICFDVFTNDADVSQNVTMTTNNGIPGGQFTILPGNRPTGTFCWTPGFDDIDLLPKTITVTVVDDNCPSNGQQTFSFSIFVPSPFFSFTSTPATCHGGTDGTASATAVFGNLYSYSWNSIPVQNTPVASGLSAGTYILTVSDTNLCSLSVPVTVYEPSSISVLATVAHVTCHAAADGLIDITVDGGALPYTFDWSNNAITEDVSGLSSGSYTVIIFDANGCSMSQSYSISEPSSIAVSFIGVNINCFGNSNGAIDLNVTGGTFPYDFFMV
ncbi:MAG: SprB repeat-containing protein [Bacteroidetes bacterium]|nr:SprB repeat-containing protein [Bacteroidota bacterium]